MKQILSEHRARIVWTIEVFDIVEYAGLFVVQADRPDLQAMYANGCSPRYAASVLVFLRNSGDYPE